MTNYVENMNYTRYDNVFIAPRHILTLHGFIKLLLVGLEVQDVVTNMRTHVNVYTPSVYFSIIFYLSFEKFSNLALG